MIALPILTIAAVAAALAILVVAETRDATAALATAGGALPALRLVVQPAPVADPVAAAIAAYEAAEAAYVVQLVRTYGAEHADAAALDGRRMATQPLIDMRNRMRDAARRLASVEG